MQRLTQLSSTKGDYSYTGTKVNHRLLILLESKGLSQSDLGLLVSKDRSYINRIVHGIWNPPTKLKIKIAKVLGVDSRVVFPDENGSEQLELLEGFD